MTASRVRALLAGRRPPIANVDDVAAAVDRRIPGPDGDLTVRVYRPHGHTGARPGVVFFHGGGFVLCDLDSHDGFCRAMARHTQAVVVAVDYRLAPEHRAPAAALDCFAAYRWVVDHAADLGIDPTRLLVAGDSAGGNLAAVTALLCRDDDVRMPLGQVLIYPVIDPACDTPSYRAYATGYVNTAAAMRWYWRQYLDGATPTPLVAPARADDHRGLPPAVIVTAGFDVLHDEGEAYARQLRDANVAVLHRDYPGLFHGFISIMVPFAAGAAARDMLWHDMRELLQSPVRAAV
jgi:acetyl esterase